MTHLITTFFWEATNFSGTSQLDVGPWNIGNVNKLFRLQTRGTVDFHSTNITSPTVFGSPVAWGVQIVAHGTSPSDVISDPDSDQWLMRVRAGTGEGNATWSPNSNTATTVQAVATADDWAGQLALGAVNIDAWVSFKGFPFLSLAEFDTYGTLRFWWT